MLGWSDAPDAPMKAREKGTVTRKLIVPIMSSALAQRVGHPVPVFQLAYFAAVNFRELWHFRELSSEHPSIGASEHVRNCRFCASLTCRYRLRGGAYICSEQMARFLCKSAAECV